MPALPRTNASLLPRGGEGRKSDDFGQPRFQQAECPLTDKEPLRQARAMSRAMPNPPDPLPAKHVVVMATATAQSLEVAGPVEVFAMAAAKLREAGRSRATGYLVEIASVSQDLTIRSPSGLSMLANRPFWDIREPIDTLLIAGGMEVWSGADSPELLAWIRERASSARRLAAVCTGSFVLAEAGLLDGVRATTHWYFCQQLQKDYPNVIVDPKPIYIQEGRVSTSAGVTCGIDLSLALVEQDFGADIALRIARALVLFLRRPAGQNQFSTSLAFQGLSRVPLRELPVYILEHLREPLSVEQLAARVAMSVRNFSRVFAQEYGDTPAAFVETLRLETARRLVEESDRSFEEIAADCGLGVGATMRRAFVRRFDKTPAEIRNALQ